MTHLIYYMGPQQAACGLSTVKGSGFLTLSKSFVTCDKCMKADSEWNDIAARIT